MVDTRRVSASWSWASPPLVQQSFYEIQQSSCTLRASGAERSGCPIGPREPPVSHHCMTSSSAWHRRRLRAGDSVVDCPHVPTPHNAAAARACCSPLRPRSVTHLLRVVIPVMPPVELSRAAAHSPEPRAGSALYTSFSVTSVRYHMMEYIGSSFSVTTIGYHRGLWCAWEFCRVLHPPCISEQWLLLGLQAPPLSPEPCMWHHVSQYMRCLPVFPGALHIAPEVSDCATYPVLPNACRRRYWQLSTMPYADASVRHAARSRRLLMYISLPYHHDDPC